jgi:hypothetical protein
MAKVPTPTFPSPDDHRPPNLEGSKWPGWWQWPEVVQQLDDPPAPPDPPTPPDPPAPDAQQPDGAKNGSA